jgi:hypothetical protein
MNEEGGAQLHLLAHDSAVHAALLMDLLRIVQQISPEAFQHHVEQAERESHQAAADPKSPLQGRSSRSVLDHRLAYLRSVQIQASVGYPRELEREPAAEDFS